MASYIFLGLFTKSKVGATPANSPTIDIVNIDTNTLVVTGGSPSVISAMTGLYSYTYTGASGLRLVGLFKTTDTTVDLRHLPSYTPTEIVSNLDSPVSDIPTSSEFELRSLLAADYTVVSDLIPASTIADAVWDEALSFHSAAGSAGNCLSAAGAASDPLLNQVPGTYASGTAGAALGNIAGASVSVVSPVASNGTSINLIYGDDYVAADNRALVFSSLTGPILTGGTVALNIQCATAVVSAAGVITGEHSCYIELTDTKIATIGVGVWRYDLQATLATSANVVTLVSGYMVVNSDVR